MAPLVQPALVARRLVVAVVGIVLAGFVLAYAVRSDPPSTTASEGDTGKPDSTTGSDGKGSSESGFSFGTGGE